jgi:hypothetical protein
MPSRVSRFCPLGGQIALKSEQPASVRRSIRLWRGLLLTIAQRFCKLEREAENASRTKPSPAHTKNRRNRLDRSSRLGMRVRSFHLKSCRDVGKSFVNSIVHLQLSGIMIDLQSGPPMRQVASAHSSGQKLALLGKSCSLFGSFTI